MAIPFRIRRAEWVAGLFLLISLAAGLAVTFVLLKGQGLFESHKEYVTTFKESYGISVGGSVEMAGTPVGKVTKIELNDEDQVAISFNVTEDYADRVRSDTVATVNTPLSIAGVLAGSGLILSIGSADATILDNGATVISEEPRTIIDILTEVTGGETGDDVRAIVSNVRELSDTLADPGGPVTRLLDDAAGIAEAANRGEGSVARLLHDDGSIMARLDNIATNVERASARLDPLVARVGPLLDRVDVTLARIEKATEPLPEVAAELPRIAADLRALSADLSGIAGDVGKSTPRLKEMVADADRLLDDMDEVVTAAKRFYLIRINLEKIPDGPVVDSPPR